MESLEELRNRLLREERVQKMVRQRAYEIYQMRGGQPGWESHDWFQAEGEVLAFLLALESRLEDEKTTAETAPPVSASEAPSVSEAPAIRKVSPRKATTTKGKSTSASKSTTVEPAKKPASKRAASVKSAASPKLNRTRKSTKKEDQ